MTLVRIELPAAECELEIRTEDRVYKLSGGEHITIDVSQLSQIVYMRLLQAATDARGYMGVKALRLDPDADMKPVPESDKAGTYVIENGQAYYQGKSKK